MSPYLILSIVLGYIVILFVVAYFSGRGADNRGFFVGNRSYSWGMVALATTCAAMSGVTFVSVPGMVATSQFSYMQMTLGFMVGQWIMALILIPLFYKLNLVSIYGYLNERFGVGAYLTGAWFFFISKLLGASVRLFLVCIVMQRLVFDYFGISFVVNALFVVVLVLLYTIRGGVKSLIWTDSLKSICLVGSIVLCIIVVASQLNLSFVDMVAQVRSSNLSQTLFFDDVDDKRYFFKQFFAGVFTLIAMTGLDQDMMQRNLACKNYRDSQKNIFIASIIQTIIIFLFLCLGVILYLYADKVGITLSGSTDLMFPTVATSSYMPLVVGIMFILGLISSTYSAAGSALTALTTSFTIDILHADKGNERDLTATRKKVHICMAIAMLITICSIYALNNTSIIDAVYVLASYSYGPILGMFAFGMIFKTKIKDKYMILVAIIAPIICFVLDHNSAQWFGGYHFSYELLIVNALLTMLGMALLKRKNYDTNLR